MERATIQRLVSTLCLCGILAISLATPLLSNAQEPTGGNPPVADDTGPQTSGISGTSGEPTGAPVGIPQNTTYSPTTTKISEYLNWVYKIAISIGAFAAFLFIVIGAVMYTASAGNPSQQSRAKEMIVAAVFGLVLLIAATLILVTIDRGFGTLNDPNSLAEKIWAEGEAARQQNIAEQRQQSQTAQQIEERRALTDSEKVEELIAKLHDPATTAEERVKIGEELEEIFAKYPQYKDRRNGTNSQIENARRSGAYLVGGTPHPEAIAEVLISIENKFKDGTNEVGYDAMGYYGYQQRRDLEFHRDPTVQNAYLQAIQETKEARDVEIRAAMAERAGA